MTVRVKILVVAIIISSCQEVERPIKSKDSHNNLREYQKYAFNRIREADNEHQGFYLTDSFYLWSYNDFGRDYNKNRITRTYSNGIFYYTFWNHLRDSAEIYAEDSILTVQFVKDSMVDLNNDKVVEFIAISRSTIKDRKLDTLIFSLDSASKRFTKTRY